MTLKSIFFKSSRKTDKRFFTNTNFTFSFLVKLAQGLLMKDVSGLDNRDKCFLKCIMLAKDWVSSFDKNIAIIYTMYKYVEFVSHPRKLRKCLAADVTL